MLTASVARSAPRPERNASAEGRGRHLMGRPGGRRASGSAHGSARLIGALAHSDFPPCRCCRWPGATWSWFVCAETNCVSTVCLLPSKCVVVKDGVRLVGRWSSCAAWVTLIVRRLCAHSQFQSRNLVFSSLLSGREIRALILRMNTDLLGLLSTPILAPLPMAALEGG